MQFDLNEALLDHILFCMEDQEWEFFIDCQEGEVVSRDELEKDDLDNDTEDRFISLPEWDSSCGFRLMEHFAASLRNPMIRNELSNALNQGRGVFRAFKNTLNRHPEIEKLWFSFKEREMKREVINWYNGLREEWGLEKIGLEPEETQDLVLEDFRFRDFKDEDRAAAADLHRLCLDEVPGNKRPKEDGKGEPFALTAESGNGEFAGYVSAARIDQSLFINTLEVKSEYRGLGIGKALLGHLLEKIEPSDILHVCMDLPNECEGFSRALIREGFSPQITRYCLSLKDRGNEK
jgi:GNAT superfamily N-acetyltransferase